MVRLNGLTLSGDDMNDPLKTQVGIEFILENKVGYLEGCVIEYVCTHRDKGRAVDIRKAMSCLESLLDYEYLEEHKARSTEDDIL